MVMVGGQSRTVVGYMKDFLSAWSRRSPGSAVLSGWRTWAGSPCAGLRQAVKPVGARRADDDLYCSTLDLLQEPFAEYPGTVLLAATTATFSPRGDARYLVKGMGGGSNTPAATPICWLSVRPILPRRGLRATAQSVPRRATLTTASSPSRRIKVSVRRASCRLLRASPS